MTTPLLQPEWPATLRLSFLPDLRSARSVAMVIRTFLAEQDVGDDELFACELCLAEASNNAIEYARPGARDRPPVAEVYCTERQIELRVIDHTAGFDWPEPVPAPSPLAERGRGLFIIRSLMDEAHYLRGTDENVIIMRKTRRGLPAADPAVVAPTDPVRQQLAECRHTVANMARELCFRSETLSAVFRCCAELGSGDGRGFEERLLGDLLHLMSADWYVLRLISAHGQQLGVAAASDPEWEFPPLAMPLPHRAAAGIEAAVAASQEPAAFEAKNCPGADEPLRRIGAEARGIVYPLCFDGSLLGTIAIGRLKGEFPHGQLQEEVLRAFAEFLAIQTVTLRHREEEVRGRLIARELEIGRDIQRALLPVKLPALSGFSLAGGCQNAREIGGDFYDALALDDRSLLLVVADVMGKGIPAALFATNFRGVLRGLTVRLQDPALLLGYLNMILYPELSELSMFITALVVLVDLPTRQVTVASAGHCPPLFFLSESRVVSTLPTQGIPLGVLPDTIYHNDRAALGKPAALLLHTDGLTEARDPAGNMFGQQGLMEWLRANHRPGLDAPDLRDRLAAEVKRFGGGTPALDDQAFLLLVENSRVQSRLSAPPAPRDRLSRRSLLLPTRA